VFDVAGPASCPIRTNEEQWVHRDNGFFALYLHAGPTASADAVTNDDLKRPSPDCDTCMHKYNCTLTLLSCNEFSLADDHINPLTPELNPSTQRWLTRFFTGDFTS
jgi:hypothetical protein